MELRTVLLRACVAEIVLRGRQYTRRTLDTFHFLSSRVILASQAGPPENYAQGSEGRLSRLGVAAERGLCRGVFGQERSRGRPSRPSRCSVNRTATLVLALGSEKEISHSPRCIRYAVCAQWPPGYQRLRKRTSLDLSGCTPQRQVQSTSTSWCQVQSLEWD